MKNEKKTFEQPRVDIIRFLDRDVLSADLEEAEAYDSLATNLKSGACA